MATDLPAAGPAAPRCPVCTWLFNPFHYVAGLTALGLGLAAVVAASLVGALSHTHFDGVLDVHMGAVAPLWVFVAEGLIDWLAMGVLLFLGGMLISRSRPRAVDVFGTQALARAPMVAVAFCGLLPGNQRYTAYLVSKLTPNAAEVAAAPGDVAVFAIAAVVMLAMLVWMVALMYRAFAVSCNVRGGKAIGVFIAAILLAEALSKVAILALFAVA